MSWTKNKNVISEDLDGGTLLIDAKSGSRWTLGATASAVWKLCNGTSTVAEMASVLRRRRAEVEDFLRQFECLGLLHGNVELRTVAAYYSFEAKTFGIQAVGLGAGPRRRPSPRGNSGPG